MNSLLKYSVILFCTMIASAASATKIGVLDMHFLLKEAPQAQASVKLLDKSFDERRKKIISIQKDLKEKADNFKRNMSTNSKTENIKQERSLSRLQHDLQQLQQEYQADYVAKEREEMEKFMKLVQKAVDSVAKNNKYDVIFPKQSTAYAAKSIDTTDMVLQQLKAYKSKS